MEEELKGRISEEMGEMEEVKKMREIKEMREVRKVKEAEEVSEIEEIKEFNLTVREKEVLSLIVKGLSNPKMGDILHLSNDTIKVYVSSLLQKLNLKNRVQLAVFAIKKGLV